MPTFDYEVERAARFDTIEDARLCRSLMPHMLGGGAERYHVHELHPDGRLVDLEG
jgi:hypothetical protein